MLKKGQYMVIITDGLDDFTSSFIRNSKSETIKGGLRNE